MAKPPRSADLILCVPSRPDRRIERAARRQSLLASGRVLEAEVLEFIEHAADDQGWQP